MDENFILQFYKTRIILMLKSKLYVTEIQDSYSYSMNSSELWLFKVSNPYIVMMLKNVFGTEFFYQTLLQYRCI